MKTVMNTLMDILPIKDPSTIMKVAKHCGIRGSLKSAVKSLRYAESFPGFVFGNHTTTNISSNAIINLDVIS